MAMEYNQRTENGDLGQPIKIGTGLKLDERVSSLGEQLAQEKNKGYSKGPFN